MNVRVLSVLIILALLCACTQFRFGRTPEASIHTGTRGLVLQIEPTTPPAKVFAKDPFAVIGTITNEGTADVESGVLTVGIDDAFVSMETPRVIPIRVAGRSALQPQGEVQTVRLDLSAKELGSVTETVTSTILLTMCYAYKTSASSTICIDTDLEKKTANKPCTMQAVGSAGGQGAPIAVTRIETTLSPSADRSRVIPLFTITLDNVGGGQVFGAENTVDVCTGKPAQNANNAVVRAYLVDKELTCGEGTAVATFDRKNNVVRCTLPAGIDKSRGAFSTLVRVEADYGYSTSTSKNVQIVRGS